MENNIIKHFAPVTKSWIKKDADTGIEERFMQVTISGVKEDRDGDRISEKALNKMTDTLKSQRVPLFLDHGLDSNGERSYRIKDVVGVWTDGEVTNGNLLATVKLNNANKDAEMLWEYKNQGMPVGLSIGAKINKSFTEDI